MSVREFEDAPVDPDLLDAAIADALHSPSACNRQPYRLLLATNRDLVRRLAGLWLGTGDFGAKAPVYGVWIGDWSALVRL